MIVTATVTRNPRLLLTLGASIGPPAIPLSYLDTDGTLAANSDTKVASQKATKTYVDAHGGGGGSSAWGAITGTLTAQSDLVSYIAAAIAALINSAPGALDTLEEIADALGDDANFAATLVTSLAGKQPLDSDLTAIAALVTTSIGRSLLAGADQAALQAIIGATGGGTFSTLDNETLARVNLAILR
jgi:hypothetical protein